MTTEMSNPATNSSMRRMRIVTSDSAKRSADQAKTDFLACISHELRTPLNAIIGFTEVLRNQYFGGLNPKQEQYVDYIMGSARQLHSQICAVLDFSEAKAGDLDLERTRVNILHLLNATVDLFNKRAIETGVGLTIDNPVNISHLFVSGDADLIRQVMVNLLSNAIKFTPTGGFVRVTWELVDTPPPGGGAGGERRSGAKKEGRASLAGHGCVQISVEDTGRGISESDIKKIFTAFYQVNGGIEGKSPGMGVGLPLSKYLVEMHGGRLWAESDGEGRGSRFCFTLPIIPEPPSGVELNPV